MAIARDTYDHLKRAPSYSLSIGADSTLSIEDIGTVDIDAVVNKRWVLDEVIGSLQSQMAILSGGRDRRGAPIITMYATEQGDFRPSNVGKVLSYLSKVPDESVQGLGFTVILDAQHVSWQTTKHVLKSLQLTFVEHIHQLLIVKPKAFWQRQKTGVSVTFKKSRFRFPVTMLESTADLFHHLQVSQVTSDLGGTIKYNHQQWIDTQRILEKHLIQLLNRLDGYEHVREQLDLQENPATLLESRDSVRRHVDAKEIISKVELDCECEAVSHAIAQLRPCTNPDFIACFSRLEELSSCLLTRRDQLQRMWDEKGTKLDKIVQLRKFEHDSDQMLHWISETTASLSRDHTDIGDSLSTAEQRRQSFIEFQGQIANQYQEISRVISMGERLINARHHAADVMQSRNKQLREQWERFSSIVEDRHTIMELSVMFHDRQHKFFHQVDQWIDHCSSTESPSTTALAGELLRQHQLVQEQYQQLYNMVRKEGHRLIEKLRRPVGDSSLPSKFVLATRHIKEILEGLFDEYNWLEEQWGHRNKALHNALHLRQYQDESVVVYTWLSDRGWVFLLSNVTIGADAADAQKLIQQHDSFEGEAKDVYGISLQLFGKARKMAESGECDREMIEGEAQALEVAVNGFAANLDERRDILVQACTYYQNMEMLTLELHKLTEHIPQDQFTGQPREVETRLQNFEAQRAELDERAKQVFSHCDSLVTQLETVMESTSEEGHAVNYTPVIRSIQQHMGEMRNEKRTVDESCARKETRWSLTLQLVRIQEEAQEHLSQLDTWCSEQSQTELEPSTNTLDSQLQLDALQGQYDDLLSTHNDITIRARSVARETEQLDSIMFGSTPSSTHPVVVTVEKLEVRMTEAGEKLEGVARPRLRQLRDCLDYHLLQQRAHTLTSALHTITTSISQVSPVGHSLSSAETVLQQQNNNHQKLQAIGHDVDKFCEEVEECIQRQHYEATHLAMLARSLQENKGRVSRTMVDRVRVAKGGVGFYKGVDRLASIMEKCRTHFNSKDTVHSVSDAQRLLSTLHELKDLVEQATEGVRSQGKQLLEVLVTVPSPPPRRKNSDEQYKNNPMDTRSLSVSTDMGSMDRSKHTRLRHSSDNLIDAIAEDSESNGGEEETDSPKLLVSPRKSRPALKSYKSSPVSLANSPDQIMIETQLYKVEQQMRKLAMLWEHRKTQLETAQMVIEFMEQVPHVLSWLETSGVEYLGNRHNYGRSKEEVLELILEHDRALEGEVSSMREKVETLMESYQLVESSGHRELNQLRGVASSLGWKWNQFENDMEQRQKNLQSSLRFQDNLFKASNWCQKSQQFLDSMLERIESCDTSEEATRLKEELTVYFSYTREEQEMRVEEAKEISVKLHSNLLVEMAAQIDQSTQQTLKDLHTSQDDLDRLHEKLVQIESEKDRERRLTKQRERVLEELIQTEEVYVADLKLIVEKCRPRFVSEVLPNSLKGKEHIIFSNIRDIDAFHRVKLLPQLKNTVDLDGMAVVFMEHADEMAGVYVPYCKNKMASEDLLASHRTYLSRMQSMFGIDTPLSSLLIKPVQRITKYPLLLKDAIKYTTLLGLPIDILEGALIAVERILDETNNTIHLSHLEISEEQLSPLGQLYFQCSLLVSEPKFAIKAEKERQVFVFDSALLFARKVLLGPAKFKYEYKSKIPITVGLQLGEFVDGEPFKFTLTTADHKLHLKAASLEAKQVAVRAIRTAVFSQSQEALLDSAMFSRQGNSNMLGIDRFTKDLLNPSPKPSPPTHRRANGSVVSGSSPTMNGFDRYQLTSDYTSGGDHPLSLKKGAVVEVLDSKIEDKWFVRTLTSSPEAGWIPSTVLEQMSREEVDGKGKMTITSGPLHASQQGKLRQFRSQTAFGSRDLQSQQVISTLKKVTLQDEVDEEDEGGTSLDRPQPQSFDSPRLPRSPPQSQQPLLSASLDQRLLQVTVNGTTDDGSAVPGNTRSTSWNKSRNTRRAVYRRKNKDRAHSMGSDRSESPTEKMQSGSSEENIHDNESKIDPEKAKKAQERIQHIVAEILHTEQEYVSSLDMCINCYKKEIHNPDIPSALQGKEKLIFGNIQAVCDFHSSRFLPALRQAGEDVERVAKCFLDHTSNFEVYITYCENKPKSESFLWTYQHTGGMFFEDIQNQLKHRQGLASFLIKPVQRISQYQLLLRDLQKSAQKAGLATPQLGMALELMQDVPKRANDAMTLSMICGYDGNISASGQLIMHDEFTVYERSRWTGASRHLFLMDQRLILTKEKDADGLYVYKDSLKVHSLSIVEKQDDNPNRFAVGTGPINSWDQYYVLEASSPEKRSTWVEAIKTILKQQFALLKALKQPLNARQRSKTVGPAPLNSVAMISDSEEEDMEEDDDVCPSPFLPMKGVPPGIRRQTVSAATVGEVTAATPTVKTRPLNLYVVAEDCAPPKENEGILYIRRGQVYDVIDNSSDWWFARLVRDITPDGMLGKQGWVAGSFLDKFSGELSFAEQAAIMSVTNPTVAKKSATMPLPSHTTAKKQTMPKSPKGKNKMIITSSFQFDESAEEGEEEEEARPPPTMKAPQIVTHLTDETVIVSRTVRLRCKISKCGPEPSMEWSHNGRVISHDRAFSSLGDENCLLRLQNVTEQDEGVYTCTVCNQHGCCSSSAKLTVIGPPSPPGRLKVKPVTSTSVRISWNPPTHTGHSPITLYHVECKDTLSGRWSTVMKRITEPNTVMDDLMPGTEYVFRVLARNHIGSSQPSLESEPVQTAATSVVGTEFSLEPFYDHYNLMNILARGQFSEVHECLHSSTQQSYAAKLIPLSLGDHAHKELEMLSQLSHPNIVNVTAAYQTDQHFIFLFQLLKGQNLFEYTTVMDCSSERHAAYCTEQVLSALEYLHNLNIVHLAIRPENIMVMRSEVSADPLLKLMHFSRAQELSEENTNIMVKSQHESVEFEAPEILKNETVSTATDMWSLGVLLYIFLGGTSPFLVDSVDLTKDNICNVRYSFPAKSFKGVSESAKEVISGLLVGDSSGRLSAVQCLLHPWIQSKHHDGDNTLDLSRLKSYVMTKKWQTTFTISSADQ